MAIHARLVCGSVHISCPASMLLQAGTALTHLHRHWVCVLCKHVCAYLRTYVGIQVIGQVNCSSSVVFTMDVEDIGVLCYGIVSALHKNNEARDVLLDSNTCLWLYNILGSTEGSSQCTAAVEYDPTHPLSLMFFILCRKTISCVAFSSGGKHLAAGECGHQPCIRVWDVATQAVLSELQGHTFGVACVVRSVCVCVCVCV